MSLWLVLMLLWFPFLFPSYQISPFPSCSLLLWSHNVWLGISLISLSGHLMISIEVGLWIVSMERSFHFLMRLYSYKYMSIWCWRKNLMHCKHGKKRLISNSWNTFAISVVISSHPWEDGIWQTGGCLMVLSLFRFGRKFAIWSTPCMNTFNSFRWPMQHIIWPKSRWCKAINPL